ncbi:Tetratricopeptide repeat-containing domain [Phaffia rhodozyma]|uniref:Tetratricopeptide repeat-containing domain n=1 Tax=Phaffia rhodozyma TaxID=264483 RepID=A0A0F7SHS3_PHARH|nr:Tetratricopeptide repeat-containing domain [Phaffia rhodozyma]
MSELFKDVPEFIEGDIGESIASRTEVLSSFRELGGPDLCHVMKSTGKSAQKDVGSYHYCSGVEASSSASLAAYLNSLQFAVEEQAAWFSKGPTWKVRSGTYCCFNAFSRVDVRVDVKIPGGVDAYVVDLRGERHEATPDIWQETYVSALLRAIRYADDPNYRLAGYRKIDPITTLDGEIRFLQAAESLFFKGWQLGSDPEIQVASVVSNHLTAGLLKYFGDSFRFDKTVNLFERLLPHQPEVAALLATSYFGMNEEVKAVQIIHHGLQENPQSYPLLHVQCDFLRSKGKLDWALQLAREAVNCAPSEFVTWAKLTEVYIEQGEYESALLTLNSCPMFTYNERDLHRMPTPMRTHLPVRPFIAESNILDEDSARDNEADIALLRLPAPSLRGTFAKAYALLTRLVAQIGWDELLRSRSAVFVMEEEYRLQKQKPEATSNGHRAKSSRDVKNTSGEGAATPSSTRAVHNKQSSEHSPSSSVVEFESGSPSLSPSKRLEQEPNEQHDIPTITISSESDRDAEEIEESKIKSVEEAMKGSTIQEEESKANGDENAGFDAGETAGLEKPELAQHPGEGEGGDEVSGIPREDELLDPEDDGGSSFSTKRLCERWLDNLFMVLYEDLRVYTIWRAEISHFKTQHMSYRKTGTEWEILGDLALRLQHKEEAKDAYQRCLDSKFSSKAWQKLLENYADEGDLQKTLNAATRLTTYNWRWYTESCYPTSIAHEIFKVGQVHGHSKIAYTLLSMNLPEGILGIMQTYLKFGSTFRVEGSSF